MSHNDLTSVFSRLLQLSVVITLLLAAAITPQPVAAQSAPAATAAETASPAALAAGSTEWSITEFDTVGQDIGLLPSIAIHPYTQQPWIVFRNKTLSRMEMIHRVPNGGGNCGPNNTWQCDVLANDVGEISTITFSATGARATGYSLLDRTKVKVQYVVGNTTYHGEYLASEIEGNDPEYANGQVRFASAAFAADNTPRYLFQKTTDVWCLLWEYCWRYNSLRYAYPTANGNTMSWQASVIDPNYMTYDIFDEANILTTNGYYPSIDISLNNQVAAAYRSQTSPTAAVTLKYAEYVGGSTYCNNPEKKLEHGGYGWACGVIDPANGSGNYINLHLPHCNNCGDGTRIAYYNAVSGLLRFARYTGVATDNCGSGGQAKWKCITIDDVGGNASMPMGVAMVHDQGTPQIAYYDRNDGNGRLKLATYIGPGALFANCGGNEWQCDVVDNGGGAKSIGQDAAAAIDNTGRIYIAYYNVTDGALRVAMQKTAVAPDFTLSVTPNQVNPNEKVQLTYTLTNKSFSEALSNFQFQHNAAGVLALQTDTLQTTCNAKITLPFGILLNVKNGFLPKQSSCTITLSAIAMKAGSATLTTSLLQSNEAATVNAAATTLAVLQSQSINFAALSSKLISDPPFALSATADSGLPVSFTASGVCAVNGNQVTLSGTAGTCSITAKQAGNQSFAPAANVLRTFPVNSPNKQNQTINFAALSNQVVTSAPFALAASATSGEAVSFSGTTPTVCTVANGTVTLVTTGLCTIVASQAGNATFNAAADVEQSFQVTKADQAITFALPTVKSISEASFELAATSSSGLAVGYSSSTPLVCSVDGTTATLLATGLCTIVASQPGNERYAAAADVAQSVTISDLTNQPQTITFGAIGDQLFGASPLPLLVEASSGLAVIVVSDTPAVCTVAGETLTLVAPGTCTVTATQPGNGLFAAAQPVQQSFAVKDVAQGVHALYLPLIAR